METTTQLPELSTLFAACNMNLQGITWDNLHILGDINIECIAEEIKTVCLNHQILKDYTNDPLISKEVNSLYGVSVNNVKLRFVEECMSIISCLTNTKSGKKKPLLPNLRKFESYQGDHMVVYTGFSDNPNMEKIWRSAIHCNNDFYRFKILFLLPRNKDEILDQDALGGYYYKHLKKSAYIMLYEDLMWFQNNDEKEFRDLYYINSEKIEIGYSQQLWEERLLAPSKKIVPDFLNALEKFVIFFEKLNVKEEEEGYQRNFLLYIHDKYEDYLD